MQSTDKPNLFQMIRLGIALDDIDEKVLLEHLLDLNEYQQTLLHEAISHKQPDYALFLIDKGVNVQQADYTGATALHFATYYRFADVVSSILRHHGNPNTIDEHGNNPLWTAVLNARGDYQMVVLLKEAGADPHSKNRYGKSPLDIAVQIKDEALQRILTSNL